MVVMPPGGRGEEGGNSNIAYLFLCELVAHLCSCIEVGPSLVLPLLQAMEESPLTVCLHAHLATPTTQPQRSVQVLQGQCHITTETVHLPARQQKDIVDDKSTVKPVYSETCLQQPPLAKMNLKQVLIER